MIQYYNIHTLHKVYQWAGGCKSLLEGMQMNAVRGVDTVNVRICTVCVIQNIFLNLIFISSTIKNWLV